MASLRRTRSRCVRHMGTAIAASTAMTMSAVSTSVSVNPRWGFGARMRSVFHDALPRQPRELAFRVAMPLRNVGCARLRHGVGGMQHEHDLCALPIDGATGGVTGADDL